MHVKLKTWLTVSNFSHEHGRCKVKKPDVETLKSRKI